MGLKELAPCCKASDGFRMLQIPLRLTPILDRDGHLPEVVSTGGFNLVFVDGDKKNSLLQSIDTQQKDGHEVQKRYNQTRNWSMHLYAYMGELPSISIRGMVLPRIYVHCEMPAIW